MTGQRSPLRPSVWCLTARMHERVTTPRPLLTGRTALNTDPGGIAAREATALWIEIKGKL